MSEQTILAVSNFAKYIPLNLSGFKGIFACEIKPHANVLKMDITLYQIRNLSLFENISEGLNRNPEAKNLVDTIDKEIIFQESVSQMDSISIKHGFQRRLNEYSSVKPTDELQLGNYVTLHGIIPNLNNLYLQYEHAYIVYSFFKFFIDSYDMVKMSFQHSSTEEPTKKDVVGKHVDDAVKDDSPTSRVENDIPVSEDNSSGIFLEMMGVVNSQAMRTFIARNIFNKKWDLESAVSIKIDGNKTVINHHPLYDFNIWQYSSMHNNELINMLAGIPEENTFELANKLRQVTKQLMYIMHNSELLKDQDHSKYIFTISVGLFLLYIYSLKMMDGYFVDNVYTASTRNSADYAKVVNYAFKYVFEKFNVDSIGVQDLKEITITITDPIEGSFDPTTEKLGGIFEQYKYLASVDQDEFFNVVFSKLNDDAESEKVDDSTVVDDLELSFGKPTLINIKSFIRPKEFTNDELSVESIFKKQNNSLLEYVDIPLNGLFKSNRILTYFYCQMLFIQYNSINRKLLEMPDYTSPIIRRYSDIIIGGIFKEIDNNQFLATNTTSSFQIYRHFISPFIKNETITSYTSLTLLYQIAIPHICNMYNVEKFVDNFH